MSIRVCSRVVSGEGISLNPDGPHVGCYSVLEGSSEDPIVIDRSVQIGHHATIESGVFLSQGVIVDNYCLVGRRSRIGRGTQILYGAKVFEDVEVGSDCLIGGAVSNWTHIGNNVTFMGLVAHSYRQPAAISEWNTAAVPSPTVENGAIVGEGAILVGGVRIGEGAYVAAGECVRCDIPPRHLYLKGRMVSLESYMGFIRGRA